MDYECRPVYWNMVETTGPEEYDEAFLASLRTELKALEIEGKNVLLVPMRNSGDDSFWASLEKSSKKENIELELFEYFTAAMLHLARRVKDCKNVLGFAYPNFTEDWYLLEAKNESLKENFSSAFQKKHKHYIFN